MKKTILLLIIILLAITLTGCSLGFTSREKNIGGVFKSFDFGEKWEAVNLISKEGRKETTINNVNANIIAIDPQDHRYVYLGTNGNGLWYSENAGGNWRNILSKGNILALALDAQNSGVVYISLGQQVYKSINLGENWQSIYLEEREDVLINNLVIDPNNNLLLYISTSNGELYKTKDGGESWQLILSAERNDAIQKILINPKNTNIIYAAAAKQGIYKSINQGTNWQKLNFYDPQDKDKQKKYKGVELFRDLVFNLTQNDALIYASSYGLLKSNNGGATWYDIKLLTPANSIIIRALAVDPSDNNKIYYSTDTALYRTFDAGQTWLTSSLPSTRSANDLVIDYQTPNVMYLGMASLQ